MKITLAQFEYVKDSGEESDRRVIIVSKPSDSYLGVEVDDLQDPNAQTYICYLKEKEQLEKELKAKYNLKDLPFKRFKSNGISSLQEAAIQV
jgi:hypothetical protein